MNKEQMLEDLLNELNKNVVKNIIAEYISKNNLHSEYIEMIPKISADYIDKSNSFIARFKRDVNALYVDKQLGYKVMKDTEINEKNWFWYARLLRSTEDEIYPKQNYFQPTYLLKRLKPIIAEINEKELDEELFELYQVCLNLYHKYGIVEE